MGMTGTSLIKNHCLDQAQISGRHQGVNYISLSILPKTELKPRPFKVGDVSGGGLSRLE
jgi:hypothetical protein